MQAQHPCSAHEDQQISIVCLDSKCKNLHLFCKMCEANHNNHHTITYSEFKKRYEQLRILNQTERNKIKQQFAKVKETFALCIGRAQARIIKELLPAFSFPILPKLDSIQAQQLYGLVEEVSVDSLFNKLSTGATNIEKHNKQLTQKMTKLEDNIQQLNSTTMVAINKFMASCTSGISSVKIKQNVMIQVQAGNAQNQQYFRFCEKYKPNLFTISKNGAVIQRNTNQYNGLSNYAIVDKPLSKEHSKINFCILTQAQRFIYIGVCDPQTFLKFGLRGPVYEKGNKMYAIRQSMKEGFNAITLHNSEQKYSNKDAVAWDFAVGDIISIQFYQTKNLLMFTCNAKLFFQMPLDKQTTRFYPFVGLKFQYDSIKILSDLQSDQAIKSKQDKQKKSIFASLLKFKN